MKSKLLTEDKCAIIYWIGRKAGDEFNSYLTRSCSQYFLLPITLVVLVVRHVFSLDFFLFTFFHLSCRSSLSMHSYFVRSCFIWPCAWFYIQSIRYTISISLYTIHQGLLNFMMQPKTVLVNISIVVSYIQVCFYQTFLITLHWLAVQIVRTEIFKKKKLFSKKRDLKTEKFYY